MGVYQNIKDKFIMKNAWEDWTEYRSKLTEIILERNPKTVMIVGAGRCNDIDLERLLKSAERVICMDVDDEAMKAAVTGIPADIQHMVECREVSLTGIGESDLDSFCDDMLMMARAKGRDLTLDYFRAQMISCMNALKEKLIGSEEALLRYMPVESVDVVVCAGVHSQLFSTLSFFIRSLIASLYDIIPNVGSLEAEANDIIREMNNRVIPIIDSALCRMADKAVIFGNEDNPDSPVEGAAQCIRNIQENMKPVERHLYWEFNRAEEISYDMLIQICDMGMQHEEKA